MSAGVIPPHPDHRHRHPRRRAARPVDVADVDRSGATSCPTCAGTTTHRRRRGSSATSGSAPSRPRPRPAGTSTRRTTRAAGATPTPRTWDAKLRLGRMDEYGDPGAGALPERRACSARRLHRSESGDPELQLGVHPGLQRLPDRLVQRRRRTGCIADHRRCRSGTSTRPSPRSSAARRSGHQGIVFTQDPSALRPARSSPTATGTRCGRRPRRRRLPVNFHIASGDLDLLNDSGHPDNGTHANYASMGVSFFLGNARTIADLIFGGICHRFPDLNFVSVESGVGWIPFALEALDWQWQNCGVRRGAPRVRPAAERVLPPPDLRLLLVRARRGACSAIEQLGPDNILYETDFPHPTSMSPGPASAAVAPNDYLRRATSPASTTPCCARSCTTTPPGSTTSMRDGRVRKIWGTAV